MIRKQESLVITYFFLSLSLIVFSSSDYQDIIHAPIMAKPCMNFKYSQSHAVAPYLLPFEQKKKNPVVYYKTVLWFFSEK